MDILLKICRMNQIVLLSHIRTCKYIFLALMIIAAMSFVSRVCYQTGAVYDIFIIQYSPVDASGQMVNESRLQ